MTINMEFEDNYSQGCKACQKGTWLCIYLTYLCNAKCSFCPSPFKNRDFINSAFGNDPVIILKYLERYPFEGISFSGGESFMVYDRMLSWLNFFRKNKPRLYYWAYTNGINIKNEQLDGLKNAGLNELRFNIAASGYIHPTILKTIAYASRLFEHVAVEVPSIPEDYELIKSVVPALNENGVDYLNLHEYILVPNDPNTKNAPKSLFLMNFDMNMDFHQESLTNTEKIKSLCAENNFNIKINSCSLMKKEHQMLGRRISMGTMLKEDHEKLTNEGFLETIYIPGEMITNLMENLKSYSKIDRSLFMHPDHFKRNESEAYLLKILPKLGINDLPKVIDFKKLS